MILTCSVFICDCKLGNAKGREEMRLKVLINIPPSSFISNLTFTHLVIYLTAVVCQVLGIQR